jgi:ABC-type Na+ efflux pump permease subunit
MLFGPILSAELVRVARQRRWYVLRVLLGLGLLMLLWAGYEQSLAGISSVSMVFDQDTMRWIILRMLPPLALGQALALILLTPALTAGAIAEEKQRKTLHYILASRLTSLEIVGGKLAARVTMVLLPIFLGLPVLVMLALLGGIEPTVLLLVYAGAFTTVLFEASLAILVSTLARRGREAMLWTVLVGLVWFFGPTILAGIDDWTGPWTGVYERWIGPWNDHLLMLTPIGLLTRQSGASRMAPATWAPAATWMIVHQAAGSALLTLAASCWLRPVFRRQDGAPVKSLARGPIGRLLRRRWRPRPHIGDRPMIWKEIHATPGSNICLLISALTVATVLLLALGPISDWLKVAWVEFWHPSHAFGDGPGSFELNRILRRAATYLFCVWSVLLAIDAGSSIGREREGDTWVSLTATPLSGLEILVGKLAGSIWATRHLAYAIAGVWVFGLVLGAFHPVGLLVAAVEMVGLAALVLALGTSASLQARTTMRGIGLAVGLLFFLALGVPAIVSIFWPGSPVVAALCPHLTFYFSMVSHREFPEIVQGIRIGEMPTTAPPGFYVAAGPVMLAYFAIAPVLLWSAYRQLERVLDRPHRLPPRRGASGAPLATTVAPA